MITIDKVDFNRLKPFNGKSTQCFEHLCYQLAIKEYGHMGTFTAIDGSGGDGGVEFYLDLDTGERWGWQCKFFGDTGRLSVAKRDVAIAESLETAIRNHGNLTRYFVCLKTDLTTESTSKKSGKFSKGEKNWFDEELIKKIPVDRSISLEFWGESQFIAFLKEPKNVGVRNFFFGELELSQEWFTAKFYENFEKVKDKYDPDLHAIDQFTKSIIDCVVLDSNYINITGKLKSDLQQIAIQVHSELHEFHNKTMISPAEEALRKDFFSASHEFENLVKVSFSKIDFVDECFKNCEPEKLALFSSEDLRASWNTFLTKLDKFNFDEKSRAYRESESITSLMSKFSETYGRFFRNYFHGTQRQLHLIADAAKGKTHISTDIAYNRIIDLKPVIFLTGDKFTDETSISDAIRKILDIPLEYSFDDLLNAMEVYGAIHNVRIPIIIDGLNETVSNRLFSPIWRNHLQGFIAKILQTKNIVIFTTCRGSYADRIWDNTFKEEFHRIDGFGDFETIHEAVDKYFTKYKLKADLFFASIEKFADPIFLKIFCEIKNPNWKRSGEISVNIEEESSYDIFKEYLSQINRKVTRQNSIFRNNEDFIAVSLNKLANYLWVNNLRELTVVDFYSLIDENASYEKDRSKADVLLDEGLVINRDIRNEIEYISFTYDVLAGYMIAENLIDNHTNLSYFKSNKFIRQVFLREGQHPLFEDVIAALCLLLPQLRGISFHQLLYGDWLIKLSDFRIVKYLPKFAKARLTDLIAYSDYVFDRSFQSLFVLPGRLVKTSDIDLVREVFLIDNDNKNLIFGLSLKTIGDANHPLNAIFFSELLSKLKMNERDITWTEYLRTNSYQLEQFISEFENQCRSNSPETDIMSRKQKLVSKIIVWFLTSTDRTLRDKVTRALYFYGIKFPEEFIALVEESLGYNDPYIWERTLAASYGIAMAQYNCKSGEDFRINLLPRLCKSLYELIFAENAPFGTTHILARDYARRLIEIGLKHHPKLLKTKQQENIRPPYSFGGIRELKEFDYGEKEYGYDGPIQMDFSNYTLGRIVKGGHAYSNPVEKIKVRKQIYSRIYDLGWSKDLFAEFERALGNANYYNIGRTRQAKVERYGKKYSWIAYFENAGLRADLGLLEKDWDSFRLSDANIDPSFPEKLENEPFFKDDILGDRSTSLNEWYENGGMPNLNGYLEVTEINGNPGPWICLDSFIGQEEISTGRSSYIVIRGLVIKNSEFDEVIKLLKDQDFSQIHIPAKRENHHTFAGELYTIDEATYSNYADLRCDIEKQKRTIKKYEPDYFTYLSWLEDYTESNLPEEIEIEVDVTKDFEILFPVMEYNWESYHSPVNDAGHTTVLGKEVVNQLGLICEPQTFDLFDQDGKLAAIHLQNVEDYNNNDSFVYIRKDLLDRFLTETKSKLVYTIWGEREVRFKTNERRDTFFIAHPYKKDQKFNKIIEYK
ncbi:hypothetical protein LZQ00_08225 [Sphingobacterium sp. SRCM116780]|uniref:hypothetical protein n=1 Tax=Sphingobacterium sp. SRCM116780 TaxID=2907623 RepID=UPI001F3F22DD|nr:hypothetical protein [Sphingobacterium sp. SRCM116780]UIR57793.1 hypothetical protein LZQ00_08225 [Sphingobacterium sp. SRCM116780]